MPLYAKKFGRKPTMTKNFVIAAFNLENLDDKSKLWPTRVKVLRPMMQRINADLLLLQEVNTLTALTELLKDTRYEKEKYQLAHTKKKDGKPYNERNLAVLSRYKIKSTKQYLHQFAPKPKWQKITQKPPQKRALPVSWERPILHCEIALAHNRVLHAINIHLKSKNPTDVKGQKDGFTWLSHEGWAEGYFLSSVKRVGQALETRKLIQQIFKEDTEQALIAVGGDFNAEIESVPFKVIIGSVEDTNNPQLRPTVMVPCEYNVPSEERYSLIHHGKGEMLDHVIVSQALYPYWVETAIFNEILPDESVAFAIEQKFPESDHAPVVARFDLPDDWLS